MVTAPHFRSVCGRRCDQRRVIANIAIKKHPIRFGSGSWTTTTGIMTGTFTRPMPIGDGKFIQPTGQRLAITMATIGHWTDGTMDHEWLFWDAQDFTKQLGLAK
jgi:hypothetical protein